MDNTKDLENIQKNDCTNNVKLWLSIDDNIKEYNNKVKSLKQQQNEIAKRIMYYMNSNELEDITFNGGRLQFNKTKQKKGLSKKKIYDSLLKYFNNDESKTKDLTNYIFNNLEVTENVKLKRFLK